MSHRCLAFALGAALLLPGCPDGPKRLQHANLGTPRALAEQGRLAEAIERYAGIYAELGPRTDDIAEEDKALVLLELRTLDAVTLFAKADPAWKIRVAAQLPHLGDASQLISATAHHLARVLATSVEAEQHATCSEHLSEILRAKIERTDLRRIGRAYAGFDDAFYRRLMRQAIADYELFAFVRLPSARARSTPRVVAALQEYERELRALADAPELLPEADAYWTSQADVVATKLTQLQLKPDEVRLDPDTRAFVESDVDAQLDHARQARNLAVKHLTGKEALPLILKALEDSLRHATFAGEAVAQPGTREQDVFASAAIALEELRRLVLKGDK